MDKAKCYYQLRARIVFENALTKQIDFQNIEHKFSNENPIVAREAVFNDFDNYIHSLLLGIGLTDNEINDISDKEIRKYLNSYIDPKTSTTVNLGGSDFEIPDYVGNGIWIELVIDNDEQNKLTIHSINQDNSDMPNPPSWTDLESEYEFYENNQYDKKNYSKTVTYFDIDEYQEGYTDTALGEHHILETPFDWTGYDVKNWWGDDSQNEETENVNREDYIKNLIERGEGEQIEFKPTLIYHFDKRAYSFAVRHIIAKTICAFLNSSGGYLLIGVTDSKEIQGLQYDFSLTRPSGKDPRDYFKLEVDKIIREYFKDIASNIRGDFETIDGTEIFMFTIFPSKNFPVFIKGQNGKEFYVRLTASSEPYTDIEEIAKYCISQWNSQK